jgi:hypothetical protein
MTTMTDALYADNHMTGGMPPSACYAPMKPKDFAARRRAEAREADRREEARLRELDAFHADDPTTGGYAPARCMAPVKDRAMLLRLRAARERLERQEAYADNQTTGGRPPEECFAPLRSGKRRADDL